MVGRARPSLELSGDENGGEGSIMGQVLALWLVSGTFKYFKQLKMKGLSQEINH